MSATYLIGDAHGDFTRLVALLREAGLIDAGLRWLGGASHLWFLGDYVDRGDDCLLYTSPSPRD